MNNIIPYKYTINPNLYVVYELLECITNKLILPDNYYNRIQALATEIGNTLFSYPENIDKLDYLGECVEVIAYYQENN